MVQVSEAATAMSKGAMANFSNALLALGRGDLDAAHARVDVVPVRVQSGDEVGADGASINRLQEDIARAAGSLDRAREELRVARHDALTGLITRREFERRLDAALTKTRAEHRWYALLYLDLDHFKIVNDTCGHAAGDELLRQITGVLRRSSATATASHVWGRRIRDAARRLPAAIRGAYRGGPAGGDPGLQFRVGRERSSRSAAASASSLFCDGSVGLLELMRASDAACYIAKKKGRDRVQIYQPADIEVAARQGELDWVGRLQLALHERRSACTRRKSSSFRRPRKRERHQELLVRMIDEEGGLVNPMAFIPVAERYNLMPAIDRLVISTSFEEIARIIPREGPVETHRWAINLSGAR